MLLSDLSMNETVYEVKQAIIRDSHGDLLDYYEDSVGGSSWKLNGFLHRRGGPAIETDDGRKCWFIHGKRHREDGPAIIHHDGLMIWCIDGNMLLDIKSQEQFQRYLKLKSFW